MRIEKELPYHVRIENRHHSVNQYQAWCKAQLGERWEAMDWRKKNNWTCFWSGNIAPKCYDFFFRHEADAVLFSLRWI